MKATHSILLLLLTASAAQAQMVVPYADANEHTFENNTYNIRVTHVIADSYTLKLNDASLTRPIDPGANRGGAQRDK